MPWLSTATETIWMQEIRRMVVCALTGIPDIDKDGYPARQGTAIFINGTKPEDDKKELLEQWN